MRSFLAILALAIAVPFAGAAGQVNRVSDGLAERAYALRGDLTASLALDLQAALRAGFRRIAITSRGGEVLVARAMGDLINQAGALLVADGQCHSACTYLWLASRRRALGREADLALHATFDNFGVSDFGELWLRELGFPSFARWARSRDLHHLSPDDLLAVSIER